MCYIFYKQIALCQANSVYKHINWKMHAACDLNIIVKCEGLLKVTGSQIHWKL